MNAVDYISLIANSTSSTLTKISESVGLVRQQLGLLDKAVSDFAENALNRVRSLYSGLQNWIGSTVSRAGNFITSTLDSIRNQKGLTRETFGVNHILEFGNKVLEATQRYNGFRSTLSDTFHSVSVGEAALNTITKFATDSPYTLESVVGSFNNLAKNGILPTKNELYGLGDLASSSGKNFEQISTAILDAQKGNFENLKSFGVEASASGDKVRLSFNGANQTVENNGQAIKSALAQFGNMPNVAGAMQEEANSFNGLLTYFRDLKFLADYIPLISKFFEILGETIQPVVNSVWNLLKGFFSFASGAQGISTFSQILSGAVMVVDVFSIGLSYLIDILAPFVPTIAAIVAGITALNIVMALSPIQWIIIGIVSLITIIGLLIKYTDGWGKSWDALGTMFTLIWQQIRADFNFGIDSLTYGFTLVYLHARDVVERIIGTFANLGEAISLALDGQGQAALDKAFSRVNTAAEAEIAALNKEREASKRAYQAGSMQRGADFEKARSNFGITFNTAAFAKDFKNIKDKFTNVGQSETAYTDHLNNNPKKSGNNNSSPNNASGMGITNGGAKATNITINLAKMQDQIVINTVNAGEGASKLREMLEEELNRLLSSITQMQTTS